MNFQIIGSPGELANGKEEKRRPAGPRQRERKSNRQRKRDEERERKRKCRIARGEALMGRENAVSIIVGRGSSSRFHSR